MVVGIITARCAENRVNVIIERVGNVYMGKIRDMPMALFAKIADLQHGERIIEQIVRSAEREFYKVYYGQCAEPIPLN